MRENFKIGVGLRFGVGVGFVDGSGFGCRVWIEALKSMINATTLPVRGFRSRVQGSGFRVQGSGFRVQGSGHGFGGFNP